MQIEVLIKNVIGNDTPTCELFNLENRSNIYTFIIMYLFKFITIYKKKRSEIN